MVTTVINIVLFLAVSMSMQRPGWWVGQLTASSPGAGRSVIHPDASSDGIPHIPQQAFTSSSQGWGSWSADSIFGVGQRDAGAVERFGALRSASSRVTVETGGLARPPSWHIVTDCTTTQPDCPVTHQYAPYPFVSTTFNEPQRLPAQGRNSTRTLPDEWLAHIRPDGPSLRSFPQLFPARHSYNNRVRFCDEPNFRDLALGEQIRRTVTRLARVHGMLSFTVTNDAYASDMIDDVADMAETVLGFRDAFFLAVLDNASFVAACERHIPVVYMRPTTMVSSSQSVERAKAAEQIMVGSVKNAKLEVSKWLVDLGCDFFFFEMDVWFFRSPWPILAAQKTDLLFSSHQNNPKAGNIGVFSVRANERTQHYFRDCLNATRLLPEEHDQRVVLNVAARHQFAAHRQLPPVNWKGNPPIETPKFPISYEMLDAHIIAASITPLPTETSIGIHVLDVKPMQSPHGKKMIAKELGTWCVCIFPSFSLSIGFHAFHSILSMWGV